MVNSRQYWVSTLDRIVSPVLEALAHEKLKESMPENLDDPRYNCTHLEAFARTLMGIAPWLEAKNILGVEREKQQYYAELCRTCLDKATDAKSKDKMNFLDDFEGDQAIVDTAFLAYALLKSPNELWGKCDDKVKINVIKCFKATRKRKPCYTNWLLFSALIEAFLYKIGEEYDPMRIDYALRQFNTYWYKGDGMYSDGPHFAFDYYNSFVIHPFMILIIETTKEAYKEWGEIIPTILERSKRYSEIQERLISPDGTFAIFGRSVCYRMGAFTHLANMCLLEELPKSLSYGQVRSGLTEVIKKCIEVPNTFNEHGYLNIGLCGHQPSLGEGYISTGSLYLCTTIFSPLGLDENHEFWTCPDELWTSKKIWSGIDVIRDHGIE